MNGITPDQMMNAVVVILAVFAAIVAVDKFADVIKKWKSPEKDMYEKLRSDKLKLDEHERELIALKDGQQVLCSGIVALLDHQLHNGNTDQMEKARNGINDYLSGLIKK